MVGVGYGSIIYLAAVRGRSGAAKQRRLTGPEDETDNHITLPEFVLP